MAESCTMTSMERVKAGAWVRDCTSSYRMSESNLKLVWLDTLVELANRRRVNPSCSLNWSLLHWQKKGLGSRRTRGRDLSRMEGRWLTRKGLGSRRTRGRDLGRVEGRWMKGLGSRRTRGSLPVRGLGRLKGSLRWMRLGAGVGAEGVKDPPCWIYAWN